MKRAVRAVIFLLLIVEALPLHAYAYSSHQGMFVSSDYSEAYHILFCRDVSKIGNHRAYYDSTDAAEADGKRPCQHCGKYIRIIRGDYVGTEEERELVDVFLEGYYAGVGYSDNADVEYEKGVTVGYENGYNRGYKVGESAGYISGWNDKQEASKTAVAEAYIISAVIGFVLIISISLLWRNNNKLTENTHNVDLQNYKTEINKLRLELNQKKEVLDVVDMVAEECGMSTSQLMERFYIIYLMKTGLTEEEAKAQLHLGKQKRANR